MRSDDLVAIIDFLYHGEVNIYQDNLDNFLTKAEELKLKGFTGDDRYLEKNKQIPKTIENSGIYREATTETVLDHTNNKSEQEVMEYEYPKKWDKHETALVLPKEISADSQELDEKIKSVMILGKKVGERIYKCQVCGKESKCHNNMRNHIESNHIEGASIPCNHCTKTFRSGIPTITYLTNKYLYLYKDQQCKTKA